MKVKGVFVMDKQWYGKGGKAVLGGQTLEGDLRAEVPASGTVPS